MLVTTSNRIIGSRSVSRAIKRRVRFLVPGRTFGPYVRSRVCASSSDNGFHRGSEAEACRWRSVSGLSPETIGTCCVSKVLLYVRAVGSAKDVIRITAATATARDLRTRNSGQSHCWYQATEVCAPLLREVS